MRVMNRANGPRGIEIVTPVTCDRMVTQFLDRLRGRFQRSAAHAHAHAAEYIRSRMGDAERKNSWQLVEYAGHVHPPCMQRVLARYRWDAAMLSKPMCE